MILVLAGTEEGRRVASTLVEAGYEVAASAVTGYGGQLLRQSGVYKVYTGRLEREQLSRLLESGIKAVVDATHPYAVNITRVALQLCREKSVPYLRLERPASPLPSHPLVIETASFAEAGAESIRRAAGGGGSLFSTMGSKNLPALLKMAAGEGIRVVARVLPDPAVLAACLAAGMEPRDIIVAQGPFSRSLNRELFRAYRAAVVLTKESGPGGGTEAKINAALDLGIPVVVWRRPRVQYPSMAHSPEEILTMLKALQI